MLEIPFSSRDANSNQLFPEPGSDVDGASPLFRQNLLGLNPSGLTEDSGEGDNSGSALEVSRTPRQESRA